MKKMIKWVFAATLVCGSSVLTSCKTAKAVSSTAQKVEATELIRTSQSWDGVELPDYFKGRPELVAVKYVFPAGKKLGWHPTSPRRICPWLFSIQRFQWTNPLICWGYLF